VLLVTHATFIETCLKIMDPSCEVPDLEPASLTAATRKLGGEWEIGTVGDVSYLEETYAEVDYYDFNPIPLEVQG